MARMDREVVDLICASMRREPDAWEVSTYNAINKKLGVEVWIANGLSCLRYKMFGRDFGSIACFTAWAQPSRVKLWLAARALYRAKFVDPVDQKIRAWKFQQAKAAAEEVSAA